MLFVMQRRCEPELMDRPDEVDAYANANFADVNERFVARALELAGEGEQLDVVDLGCGPGDMTIDMARRRPGWRVVGADASEPMLAVARRRSAGVLNVRFVHVDAKFIDASLGQFDLLTSNSLLHHLPEPAGFWASLHRIARPHAVLFLRDLFRPATEEMAKTIVQTYAGEESKLLQDEFHRSLLAAFTVEEVRAQLVAAGLGGFHVTQSSDRHLDVWGSFGH
jgi:trans-aconitate 2-methyltransferase